MFASFERGDFDVVIATRLDRLLRRMRDYLTLRDAGIPVVLLDGNIDTTTKTGNLQVQILTAVAEFEIEMKKERALPYVAARREQGHPSPGRAPYGYDWVPSSKRDEKGTRYRINPDEAKAIRFANQEIRNDAPLGATIRAMTEKKYLTRAGKPFTRSALRHLLMSPFPAAQLPPAQPRTVKNAKKELVTVWYDDLKIDPADCVPGTWDEIIPKAHWEAARAKLTDSTRRTNGGQTTRKHLLSGFARCGVCGGAVYSAKTREGYSGYRCKEKSHFLRRAEPVEEFVQRVLFQRLAQPDVLFRLKPTMESANVSDLQAEKLSHEGAITNLVSTLSIQNLSATTVMKINSEIAKHEEEIRSINNELSIAAKANPLVEFESIDPMAVPATWFAMTPSAQRSALEAMAETVFVFPVGKGNGRGDAALGALMTNVVIVFKGYPVEEEFPTTASNMTWLLADAFPSESGDQQLAPLPKSGVTTMQALVQDAMSNLSEA